MVRYNSTSSSGNLFAIMVAVLAIALFAIIVMWPSGAAKTVVAKVPDTPLTQTLNDRETHQYLAALHRVKPKFANKLQARGEEAIASGATKDELAVLVLETYSTAVEEDLFYLLNADVKHIENILEMSERGLSTLSSKAPQYCRPSSYVRFALMEPDAIATEMASLLGYDSGGYHWMLQFNTATLEAIESGRDKPKKYGRLRPQDEMALQNTMMSLMSNPQVGRLMALQGKSQTEQQRAAMNMDFCGLGTDVLTIVNALPTETKARLLGELQHQAKGTDLKQMMRMVQSGI